MNAADRPAQPCIWMSAGLISYKLCERDFDCEGCPLDLALRGEAAPRGPAEAPAAAADFLDDRQYTPGHGWVRASDEVLRIGLDPLAVALVGVPREVLWLAGAAPVCRGETVCELVLAGGTVPLAAPLAGRHPRPNPRLASRPELAVLAPATEGWLYELRAEPSAADLLPAPAAREAARLDLRHFRRRVALDLLAGRDEVGATLPDGGRLVTDLRGMLGEHRYLALVRELVC